jgi:hypothetical protein
MNIFAYIGFRGALLYDNHGDSSTSQTTKTRQLCYEFVVTIFNYLPFQHFRFVYRMVFGP